MEITFQIEPCAESGGYVARWDDPDRGGICTQGEDLADLQAMIEDAVTAYFPPESLPERVRLHFVEDPVVAMA